MYQQGTGPTALSLVDTSADALQVGMSNKIEASIKSFNNFNQLLIELYWTLKWAGKNLMVLIEINLSNNFKSIIDWNILNYKTSEKIDWFWLNFKNGQKKCIFIDWLSNLRNNYWHYWLILIENNYCDYFEFQIDWNKIDSLFIVGFIDWYCNKIF